MNTPLNVRVDPATPSDTKLLESLLQLYLHDMSEFFALELHDDGRFRYERWPLFARPSERHFAFVLRCSDEVAGFAFVTRGSPASDDASVLDVAEFFVLRAFRSRGIAQLAARQLWRQMPGRWIVRVGEKNVRALRFWRETIRVYSGGAMAVRTHPGKSQEFQVFEFASDRTEQVAS